MSANRELQALLAQRQSYLERAISLLEGDERAVAAWLYGSLGRGTSDEWSDIDLWVAVADEHINDIRATRHEYVRQLGEPLLIVDAPQNAPQDGAFLSVLYPGEVASQHVDWTWQPNRQRACPRTQKSFSTAPKSLKLTYRLPNLRRSAGRLPGSKPRSSG
jgi:predicted nucleotidyltransferase